jgi:UDP-glucose 4-epimerase
LSNPYGPHNPSPHRDYGIINRFIDDALHGRTIKVFGAGSQVRDYIHLDDAVVAILASAMAKECHGEVFNCGGPEPLSLKDAVARILSLIPEAERGRVEHIEWPEEALRVETGDFWFDSSALRSRLNLPGQLGFDEGVRRTIGFLKGRT